MARRVRAAAANKTVFTPRCFCDPSKTASSLYHQSLESPFPRVVSNLRSHGDKFFQRRQQFRCRICSYEHEAAITLALVAPIAQASWKTSADGIEFMDSTLKTLKASLEAIRDVAMKALIQIEQSQEQHSTGWRCKQCQYIKRFTTPVALETAGRCPRCKSTEFRPVL